MLEGSVNKSDAIKLTVVIFLLVGIALIISIPVNATISSNSTGYVTGTVYDDTSNVIPNANVAISDSGTIVAEQTTNSNGDFSLELSSGEYTIVVTAAGYESFEDSVKVEPGETVDKSAWLESVGSITGDVINENSEYISGADVTLIGENSGDTIATTSTDSSGHYSFTALETGVDYRVEATYDGETGSNSVQDLPQGTTTLDVIIPNLVSSPGTISGDVVDEENEDISGADVTLIDKNLDYTIATTTTDSFGHYSFSDLETGVDYRVEATYDGETGSSSVQNLPEGTTTLDVVIPNLDSTTGSISGDVINENSEDISGADVTLIDENSGDTIATTSTDSSGHYSFTDLETGVSYRVEATYDGETGSSSVQNLPEGITTLDVVIKSSADTSGAISVKAVDQNSNPVSGATVEVYLQEDFEDGTPIREAQTDANGRAKFIDLAVGPDSDSAETYIVSIDSKEYQKTSASVSLYEPTQTSKGITVTISSDTSDQSPLKSAKRTIEADELGPGESTMVDISVEFDSGREFQIVDQFDSRLHAEIVDGAGNKYGNDITFNFIDGFGGATRLATVTYKVTIPEDAEIGTEYSFDGEIQTDDTNPISGDEIIRVVDRSETLQTAERNIQRDEIAPGESTIVDITVGFEEEQELQIVDEFDPSLNAEVVEGSGNIVGNEVTWNYVSGLSGTVSQTTVTYKVEVPEATGIGTTYTFNGEVKTANRYEITGDDTILIVDVAWYDDYVNDNSVVDNAGVNTAVSDYLTGDIDDSQLNSIVLSYLSGEPFDG